MTSLELARWQFGITTLYHFIFVPVTIGMAIFVAWVAPCSVASPRRRGGLPPIWLAPIPMAAMCRTTWARPVSFSTSCACRDAPSPPGRTVTAS